MRGTSIILLIVLLLCLAGCGGSSSGALSDAVQKETPAPQQTDGSSPEDSWNGVSGTGIGDYAKGKELFTLAETEEEAKQIAQIYGIELVSFEYGVATFHTEEDPSEVVERGRENGWPPIEINHTMQAY